MNSACPCGHGYAEAYAAIIAYGTPAAGYWRKSALVATTACSLSQVSGQAADQTDRKDTDTIPVMCWVKGSERKDRIK